MRAWEERRLDRWTDEVIGMESEMDSLMRRGVETVES